MTTEADTKKTDQPKKTEAAKASSPPLEVPRGIPVAVLRFAKPTQVPGHAVAPVIKTETSKSGKRWEIEFIPQLRHHRVTFYGVRDEPPQVLMIHETRIDNWDPVL